MDEDGPIRLKHGPDASPELVRALNALRRGVDDGARLARVAAKLGPLLDAAPEGASSSSAGQAASSAAGKLSALKVILAGLALLGPALWAVRNWWPDESAAVAKRPEAPANVAATPSAARAEPAPLP